MYINIPSGHFAYEICPIDSCPSGLSKSESRPVAGTISFGLLKGVKIDLVVDLPLWKIWKSVGGIIPNIWNNEIHVPNHEPGMGLVVIS